MLTWLFPKSKRCPHPISSATAAHTVVQRPFSPQSRSLGLNFPKSVLWTEDATAWGLQSDHYVSPVPPDEASHTVSSNLWCKCTPALMSSGPGKPHWHDRPLWVHYTPSSNLFTSWWPHLPHVQHRLARASEGTKRHWCCNCTKIKPTIPGCQNITQRWVDVAGGEERSDVMCADVRLFS